MRRIGVEMLIWSSRLLLPAALAVHILLTGSIVARRGALPAVATLLAPGVAEIAWVARLGWASAPGRIVLFGTAALLSLVVLLGLGMVAMSSGERSRTVPRPVPERH